MKNDSGKCGEEFAAAFLLERGFRILARNYHSRYGELDVVASDETHLVFLEVKTRGPHALGPPLDAVTPGKRKKLLLTAQAYLLEHPTELQPRFDVMGLTTEETGTKIRAYEYLEGAFDETGAVL